MDCYRDYLDYRYHTEGLNSNGRASVTESSNPSYHHNSMAVELHHHHQQAIRYQQHQQKLYAASASSTAAINNSFLPNSAASQGSVTPLAYMYRFQQQNNERYGTGAAMDAGGDSGHRSYDYSYGTIPPPATYDANSNGNFLAHHYNQHYDGTGAAAATIYGSRSAAAMRRKYPSYQQQLPGVSGCSRAAPTFLKSIYEQPASTVLQYPTTSSSFYHPSYYGFRNPAHHPHTHRLDDAAYSRDYLDAFPSGNVDVANAYNNAARQHHISSGESIAHHHHHHHQHNYYQNSSSSNSGQSRPLPPYQLLHQSENNSHIINCPPARNRPSDQARSLYCDAKVPQPQETSSADNRSQVARSELTPLSSSYHNNQHHRKQQQQQQQPPQSQSRNDFLTISSPMTSGSGTDSGISIGSSSGTVRSESATSSSTPGYSGDYPMSVDSTASFHQQQRQEEASSAASSINPETKEFEDASGEIIPISKSSPTVKAEQQTSSDSEEKPTIAQHSPSEAETLLDQKSVSNEKDSESGCKGKNETDINRRRRETTTPSSSSSSAAVASSSVPTNPSPTVERCRKTPHPRSSPSTSSHNCKQQKSGNFDRNNNHNSSWSPFPSSPNSWSHQFSPKISRKHLLHSPPTVPAPHNSPVLPSQYQNKNRIVECDLIPMKRSKRKFSLETDDELSYEVREEILDIAPLPGFQQAFGSTEIGRFSETFPSASDSPLSFEPTQSFTSYSDLVHEVQDNNMFDSKMFDATDSSVQCNGRKLSVGEENNSNYFNESGQQVASSELSVN